MAARFTSLNEMFAANHVQIAEGNSQRRYVEMKRMLFVMVMMLALSAAVFAQPGQRGGPPGGQRRDPIAAFKAALSLTDAQVDAIKALLQTRQERAQVILTDIQQKRQALNALLDAAAPNALNIGNAAIALRTAEKQLAAEQDWFLAELKKLLTGAQQQTLDSLIAANNGRLPLGGPGGPAGPGGPGGPGGPRGPRPPGPPPQ